ncbi:hypothetical protein AAHE18_16G099800 [Arachis hypogaea]
MPLPSLILRISFRFWPLLRLPVDAPSGPASPILPPYTSPCAASHSSGFHRLCHESPGASLFCRLLPHPWPNAFCDTARSAELPPRSLSPISMASLWLLTTSWCSSVGRFCSLSSAGGLSRASVSASPVQDENNLVG